jgi:autotransporter strand-loop-strand O-heptosyltransferase
MKDQLLNIYKKAKISHVDHKILENKIFITFNDGAKVEIIGANNKNYIVRFLDKQNNRLVHSSAITNNMWIAPNHKYFINWAIEINDDKGNEIFKYDFNLKNKRVKIINQSPSLGDCIAWTPYIIEFQKIYQCIIDFYTPYSEILSNNNKNINILEYSKKNNSIDYYASYELGYYYEDLNKSYKDTRTQNLQEVAANILGLKYKEIIPEIKINNKDRNIAEKYVCISTSSTSGCKHWQRKNGWQDVADYLNNLGYKVVVIQKDPLNYMDLQGLNNVIHPKTNSIQEAVTWLTNCEFFIGIGSGISWLSWALNKKVILISGFSKSFAEFNTPYRIINNNVCNGCWNDINFKFDPSNWNWCPKNKNFECSKEITFEMVKEKIDKAIK